MLSSVLTFHLFPVNDLNDINLNIKIIFQCFFLNVETLNEKSTDLTGFLHYRKLTNHEINGVLQKKNASIKFHIIISCREN